ncbi:MAG TPA: hypothetical protein VGH23_10665 [Rhizomicrobium sp.]|jgi:hypothetical protein
MWRLRFVIAAAMLAACAPATQTPAASAPAIGADDFEAAIVRLEQRDPNAPQALNARLQYADFLVNATTGDCRTRLDTAQAQLDILAARPATRILLPLGAAKLADGAYKLHAARADCDATARTSELRKALDAARTAAHAYRGARDYQSAAIMQFNVAAALRALNDNQAALAALKTTIAMDAEFGFQDDARDNIRLLQHWQGEDESDATIAERMKDFPAPQPAAFKFAWAPSDAKEDIAVTETNLTGGKVVQSSGAISLNRHVRPDRLQGWAVSYDPAIASASLGDWPASNDILKPFTGYLMAIALLVTPPFRVDQTGEFEDVPNAMHFSTELTANVSAGFGTPTSDQKVLARNLRAVLSPGYVETFAAEKYSLETATWAGATLQQGVWYQMSAPLSLPGLGLGEFLVTHNIAFSYARPVGCTPDDAARSCAEIIVHATPEPRDLRKAELQISTDNHLPDFDALHYWSSTELRLVVKPGTLAPYVSDMRRSWYIALDAAPKTNPMISSERLVTTTSYN